MVTEKSLERQLLDSAKKDNPDEVHLVAPESAAKCSKDYSGVAEQPGNSRADNKGRI